MPIAGRLAVKVIKRLARAKDDRELVGRFNRIDLADRAARCGDFSSGERIESNVNFTSRAVSGLPL